MSQEDRPFAIRDVVAGKPVASEERLTDIILSLCIEPQFDSYKALYSSKLYWSLKPEALYRYLIYESFKQTEDSARSALQLASDSNHHVKVAIWIASMSVAVSTSGLVMALFMSLI